MAPMVAFRNLRASNFGWVFAREAAALRPVLARRSQVVIMLICAHVFDASRFSSTFTP